MENIGTWAARAILPETKSHRRSVYNETIRLARMAEGYSYVGTLDTTPADYKRILPERISETITRFQLSQANYRLWKSVNTSHTAKCPW